MGEVDATLLREVSRSFSISLRLLPGPMRRPVSLAYLLARASDTLADTPGVAADERIQWLDGFIDEAKGGSPAWRSDLRRFSETQTHDGERRLMETLGDCFEALDALPQTQGEIVREVVGIITGGQRLDVERFASGPAVLPDDESLDDYCFRVAGCVGAFWTRIGFETLGERFSEHDADELETWGVSYGKGLQLVNILRDLPGDLENGRCYLPVADGEDRNVLLKEAAKWRQRARGFLGQGMDYASRLESRRLRAATVLPALIGEPTLDLLDGADWAELERGVKVSRATVRWCLWQALIWRREEMV
ncbi:MAG: squalene/phytoene synthase family protein [Verrucomicrobiota bacterium]